VLDEFSRRWIRRSCATPGGMWKLVSLAATLGAGIVGLTTPLSANSTVYTYLESFSPLFWDARGRVKKKCCRPQTEIVPKFFCAKCDK